MEWRKQPHVIIPCSKCGDTLKMNPFNIEDDEKITCPRCGHTFLPSQPLLDRIAEIKEEYLKTIRGVD